MPTRSSRFPRAARYLWSPVPQVWCHLLFLVGGLSAVVLVLCIGWLQVFTVSAAARPSAAFGALESAAVVMLGLALLAIPPPTGGRRLFFLLTAITAGIVVCGGVAVYVHPLGAGSSAYRDQVRWGTALIQLSGAAVFVVSIQALRAGPG